MLTHFFIFATLILLPIHVFEANGGKGEMPEQSITFDEGRELAACAFHKFGYSFTGWNTNLDGSGTTYLDQAEFFMDVTGDFLYAQWEAIEPARRASTTPLYTSNLLTTYYALSIN